MDSSVTFSKCSTDVRRPTQDTPLVVDLDGTLLRTDLLIEGLLGLIRHNPLKLFAACWWLISGRASLKARIALIVPFRPDLLPYREEVLEEIRAARSEGRRVVLCTASNQEWASAVGHYLGLFDEVIGSSSTNNLKADRKARALVERFGTRGFSYIGNSKADLPVWRVAANAISVGRVPTGREAIHFSNVITSSDGKLKDLLSTLRPQQWVKNLLVFVPLVASHKVLHTSLLGSALMAAVAFSLVASATYIVNDLVDIDADRTHPQKRQRPFASGSVPISTGVLLVPLLLCVGSVIGLVLGPLYLGVLGTYLVLTLLYSLRLKRLLLLDVMLLTGFYTFRIFAGGLACSITVSSWLLAFSSCIFFSLALLKRYSESNSARENGGSLQARRRAYTSSDASILATLGVASGVCAAVVLTIYVNTPDVASLYSSPKLLLLVCPLVTYWIGRLWILANRGCIHEDPLVHSLRDRASYAIAGCGAIVMTIASLY